MVFRSHDLAKTLLCVQFRGVPGDDLSTADKEQQAYNSIMNWLNTDAAELLAASEEPVTDRQAEFLVIRAFCCLYCPLCEVGVACRWKSKQPKCSSTQSS